MNVSGPIWLWAVFLITLILALNYIFRKGELFIKAIFIFIILYGLITGYSYKGMKLWELFGF